MNTELIKTFLVVHEQGSFSQAAKVLPLSETAISKQMNSLREELGTDIFLPYRPGPYARELTPAGKALLLKGPELIEEDNLFKQKLAAINAGHLGTLTLAIGTSLVEEIVTKYIIPLNQKETGLTYRLNECTVTEQEELLLSDKADLGITNTHISRPELFDILDRITLPYYVYCLPGHPLTKLGRPLTLEDLANVPLGLTHNSAPKLLEFMRSRNVAIYPKLRSKVRLASIAGAKQGLCCAVFPANQSSYIEGLAALPLEEPDLNGETTLYKPKAKPLTPAAKAFVDIYLNANSLPALKEIRHRNL